MTPDLHDLAAAYALDALDPDERAAYEQHYATCPTCRDEVAAHREVATHLATDRVAPPSGVRDRVLARIVETPQLTPAAPTHGRSPVGRTATPAGRVMRPALAIAAAIVIGLVGFQLGRAADPTPDDDLVALLARPDVVVNALEGSVDGSVSVVWSAGSGELAVVAHDLDDPGDGLRYQMWLLDGSGAVPSVLFGPGRSTVTGELAGTPVGWGVTIEPEGGSEQPTSDIVFVTSL